MAKGEFKLIIDFVLDSPFQAYIMLFFIPRP